MSDALTAEQIAEIGKSISTALRDDLGKHISELLPGAFAAHGLDLPAMQANAKQPVARLPMAGPESKAPTHAGWHGNYREYLKQRAAAPTDWKAFGEFMRAMHPAVAQREGFDPRLKASNEAEGLLGGFLVPDQFVATLLQLALETAVVRPRAFVMPMGAETVRIPAVYDVSHATNVFGGVQAYWVAESGAATESNPSFRQLALTARKLLGYTTVTNELLADSAIGLEALLTTMFGQAMAYFEDDAFIAGTGAGQPLGILNAPALVSVAKETGQAATSIVLANLSKMYSRMLPGSLNRAIWLAHINTFPQLAELSLSVGTGGSAVWMTNVAGGPPATIYGRPVVFTEKCETLGSLGDIYFVDFGYYVIGDRQQMAMAASPHVRFTNDESVYRFVQRLDGQPWLNSAITPRKGTTTLSPFVGLAARA